MTLSFASNSSRFWLSASVLAIMAASPALAQEQLETVTVTGIRASLQSAQSIKQNSDQVVDSISAVDIGALPDRNVAEALQRVPGVVLTRADGGNNLVSLGQINTSIMVRGLAWVKSLVNGHDEFTAAGGRSLSFSDVSADLLVGIDVFKSPDATMIEGGVGGIVDLKTRRPFDQDGQMIAVSGDYTYGDLSDRLTPSINGLYSNRWSTSIGEIGILASVDWQDQRNRTGGVRLGNYKCWDAGGSSYSASDAGYDACMENDIDGTSGRLMAPSGWDYRQMDEHQQRLASNLVLQWRPNDKLEITLNALNSFTNRKYENHYVSQNISYGQVTAGKLANGIWTGSESSLNDFDTEVGMGHNRNSDISLNVKFTPTEALEITADVQFVESSSPFRSNVLYTSMLSSPTYTIDVSGSEPKISFQDLTSTADPGNYIWSAAMDHQSYDVGHSHNARIDATYRFQGDGLFGLFKSVEAGFRTEQKLGIARATGWNWGALSPAWYWDIFQSWAKLDGTIGCSSGSGCSLEAADGNTYTTATGNLAKVNSYAELFGFGKILGNNVPSLWVPSVALTGMNTVDSSNLLAAVEHADVPANNDLRTDQNYRRWISYAAIAGCTGNDAACLAAYQNAIGGNSSGNRNSTTREQTYAGYAQLDFARETFLGFDIPINGNIGVRIVRTEDEVGSGKLVMPYLNTNGHCTIGEVAGDGIAVTDCTDYDAAEAFLGGASGEGATIDRPAVKNGYTDIMPSFNFIAHLTDEVQTRLAYSETIVRPSFSDMNASASLNFNWDDDKTYRLGMWTSDPSGSGGNPKLKPMRARNYDASLEWYFAPTGALTLSVFHKDLSDYFHSATIRQSFTHPVTGQTMDFNYTTYVNTAKGKIEGFELGYTQFYDQLPGFWGGFGIQANYTKIYNSGGVNGAGDVGNVTSSANAQSAALPIEGMSNDSYNIALMYAKYGIDARLAWNWRCHYLSSTSDATTKLPVWVENYGQLDGSVFYSFWEHYKLGFQVTNITGSEYYGDTGYADYHPRTVTIQADRKFSIVFRSLF